MQSFYKLVINYGNLLNGIWADTISHGEFWHFAHLGQMLERADKTARILDVKYFILLPNIELINSPIDSLEWSAVLKSVSAFEMYRKQFHRITYQNVARFLIFDPNFPRAMKFCINEAKESLYSIYEILDLETKIQNELAKMLDLFTVNNIDNIVMHGLHKFIDDFQINLNNLDEYIYQTFFTLKTA